MSYKLASILLPDSQSINSSSFPTPTTTHTNTPRSIISGNLNPPSTVVPALLAPIRQIVQTSIQGMKQGMRARGGDGGGGSSSGQNAIIDSAPHTGKIRARDLG